MPHSVALAASDTHGASASTRRARLEERSTRRRKEVAARAQGRLVPLGGQRQHCWMSVKSPLTARRSRRAAGRRAAVCLGDELQKMIRRRIPVRLDSRCHARRRNAERARCPVRASLSLHSWHCATTMACSALSMPMHAPKRGMWRAKCQSLAAGVRDVRVSSPSAPRFIIPDVAMFQSRYVSKIEYVPRRGGLECPRGTVVKYRSGRPKFHASMQL